MAFEAGESQCFVVGASFFSSGVSHGSVSVVTVHMPAFLLNSISGGMGIGVIRPFEWPTFRVSMQSKHFGAIASLLYALFFPRSCTETAYSRLLCLYSDIACTRTYRSWSVVCNEIRLRNLLPVTCVVGRLLPYDGTRIH